MTITCKYLLIKQAGLDTIECFIDVTIYADQFVIHFFEGDIQFQLNDINVTAIRENDLIPIEDILSVEKQKQLNVYFNPQGILSYSNQEAENPLELPCCENKSFSFIK